MKIPSQSTKFLFFFCFMALSSSARANCSRDISTFCAGAEKGRPLFDCLIENRTDVSLACQLELDMLEDEGGPQEDEPVVQTKQEEPEPPEPVEVSGPEPKTEIAENVPAENLDDITEAGVKLTSTASDEKTSFSEWFVQQTLNKKLED